MKGSSLSGVVAFLAVLCITSSLVSGCTNPPQVSGVIPNTGPLAGGTVVQVIGSNFSITSEVVIAGIPCSDVGYLGSNQLTAKTPPGPNLGNWDVEVINHDGMRDKIKGAFTYTPGPTPPTITSVNPLGGSPGTTVTITGTNIQFDVTVSFGGTTATNIVSASDGNTITCTAPPGTGVATITVTNPDGGAATAPTGFNYNGVGGSTTTTVTGATITTVAGSATRGFSGDGGIATSAQLSGPSGLAVGPDSSIFIADTSNNRIRQIGTNGTINTVAGGASSGLADGGATTSGLLNGPKGLAVDGSGNVYIADTGNHAVRKLSGGQLTTLAGHGTAGNTGDAGAATSALLNSPSAVALDASNNILVADTSNNRIRSISASSQQISNFAGNPNANAGFVGDNGAATSGALSGPKGVIVDTSASVVYIADSGNARIRKVDSSGIITTFAGTGSVAFAGDGGPALQAAFNQPAGLALDSSKSLYICDLNNQRVRVIAAGSLAVTTFAGDGSAGFTGDNGLATAATLNSPLAVATNTAANILFIADSGDGSVREVK